jgi:hypothetical protein
MANNVQSVANLNPCTAPTSADSLLMSSNVSGNAVSMRVSVPDILSNSSIAVGSTMNTTPSNSTTVPTGVKTGSIWSDGTYIYYYNGTEIKRVELSTF